MGSMDDNVEDNTPIGAKKNKRIKIKINLTNLTSDVDGGILGG